MKIEELFEKFPVSNSGVGNVPNNSNVDYLGLSVMMKPSKFLELARGVGKPRPNEIESVEYFIDLLVNKRQALGTPFLKVIPPGKEGNTEGDLFLVNGHEGRHRMIAIQMAFGDQPVEVHLFYAGESRARHTTPEWIDSLKRGMYAEDTGRLVRKPVEKVKGH